MPVSRDTQRAAIRSALKTICYNLGVQQMRPTSDDSEALIHALGPAIGETPHARPAGEQIENAVHCLTLALMGEGPFEELEEPALPAPKAGEPQKGKKSGKQSETEAATPAAEAKPSDAGGNPSDAGGNPSEQGDQADVPAQ